MLRVCIYALVLFGFLSVADFAYTYLLLEGSGGTVYEANPVAATWLDDYGWLGMAAFKTGCVFVVIGAVGLIVRYRPALGAAVACVACLATGAVNVHSHRLLAASETASLTIERAPDPIAVPVTPPVRFLPIRGE